MDDPPDVERVGVAAPAGRRGVQALLQALAAQLRLDLPQAAALALEQPFRGPHGLLCRIRTRDHRHDSDEGLEARPEVVLPLAHPQIHRLDIGRLLTLQAAVLADVGWVLGPTDEGLLQLHPLAWTTGARALAGDLAMGCAVARMVLTLLATPATPDERAATH